MTAAKETVGRIRGKLEAAPQRKCCLVGLDNVGVVSGGIDGIGTKNLSAQGIGGTEVVKFMNDLEMALPGTMWERAGPTYYSVSLDTAGDTGFVVERNDI